MNERKKKRQTKSKRKTTTKSSKLNEIKYKANIYVNKSNPEMLSTLHAPGNGWGFFFNFLLKNESIAIVCCIHKKRIKHVNDTKNEIEVDRIW